MPETYDPIVDFRYGLKIWSVFLAMTLVLAAFLPRLSMLVLAFGSLAGAEHVFRVRVHSDSSAWRLISFATLSLIVLVFLLAVLWFATHHQWRISI